MVVKKEENSPPKPMQPVFKSSLLPSNFMEKFRGVVNKQKRPEKKSDDGDYVMIVNLEKSPKTEPRHSRVEEKKSEYVSLNELPISKKAIENNPLVTSSNDSSLERKKRQGARVTLDSEGKVVYSSDSLKRKKQHTTFIPGKFVRESPTPSPLPDHRVPKTIRPVNCSGLIRTNLDERKTENRTMSPQLGKIVIKAGSRNTDSPTTDFVRMPPNRVVSPTNTPRRNDRGVRVVFENGIVKNRSTSPASSEASTLERRKRQERCVSPSSSSSSSNETKKSSELDVNPEEGKIVNESELDKLGENLDSDFSKQIDDFKLNVSLTQYSGISLSSNETNDVPDIFNIEPEPEPEPNPEIPVVSPKRPVKRSDSYRLANSPLSLISDYGALNKLTTVNENLEISTKSKCKISINDPNYKILMMNNNRHSPKNKRSNGQLRIDPSIFMISRSPNKVTKPADIELARVLKKNVNDTEIW